MAEKIRGKLRYIIRMAPAGGFQVPLTVLNGMTPQEHCASLNGEFSSPAVDRDLCVTARGKFFANDSPGAIMGGFSYYYNVLEPIELTVKTDAKLPSQNRTTIGVGEGITIYSNVPVLWEVQSNLINPATIKSLEHSKSITLTALDQAGTVTINAKNNYDSKSITLSIITPTQIKFQKIKEIHTKDVLDSGFIANLYAYPDTVNFGTLQFAELESNAVANGILAEGNGQPHGKYEDGRSSFFGASTTVIQGLGTRLIMTDTVYGGQNEYPIPLPLDEGGQASYEIEFIWTLNNQNICKIPSIIRQSTVITRDGYITTQKEDQKATFYYSDKTVNAKLNPSGQIPIPKPHTKN